jgi:hypothetical protein
MKKLPLLLMIVLTFSCNSVVEKPKNLIPEEKMAEVLYDAAILEAMRTQRPFLLTQQKINPTEYLYKKHGIDSLQFAQSNRYYASDIDKYKAMYEKVAKKLEKERKKLETVKSGAKQLPPDTPKVE